METPSDQYMAFTTHPVAIGDDVFHARVHWARVGGQMQVVGLDLRTFYSEPENQAAQAILGAGVDALQAPWGTLTTTAIRGLRFAELAEESRNELIQSLGPTGSTPTPNEKDNRDAIQDSLGGTRAKRGPKPVVSDATLENLVKPAYLNGGGKPVEAVRQALEQSGQFGEMVTIDQARKAVERARKTGLIPPYRRK